GLQRITETLLPYEPREGLGDHANVGPDVGVAVTRVYAFGHQGQVRLGVLLAPAQHASVITPADRLEGGLGQDRQHEAFEHEAGAGDHERASLGVAQVRRQVWTSGR